MNWRTWTSSKYFTYCICKWIMVMHVELSWIISTTEEKEKKKNAWLVQLSHSGDIDPLYHTENTCQAIGLICSRFTCNYKHKMNVVCENTTSPKAVGLPTGAPRRRIHCYLLKKGRVVGGRCGTVARNELEMSHWHVKQMCSIGRF